jgi:hypothetical protein
MERDLIRQFHVAGYPTLILVNPNGSEEGRVVGYRQTPTMVKDLLEILFPEGQTPRK